MPKKIDLKSECFYLGTRREGVENMPLEKYFEMLSNSKSDGGWTKDAATFLGYGRNIVCDDVRRIREAIFAERPLLLRKPELYLFGNSAWSLSGEEQGYSEDQLRLLFLEELETERERWDRLRRKFSGEAAQPSPEERRESIPESVRMYV